jgi:hypothetical protein
LWKPFGSSVLRSYGERNRSPSFSPTLFLSRRGIRKQCFFSFLPFSPSSLPFSSSALAGFCAYPFKRGRLQENVVLLVDSDGIQAKYNNIVEGRETGRLGTEG